MNVFVPVPEMDEFGVSQSRRDDSSGAIVESEGRRRVTAGPSAPGGNYRASIFGSGNRAGDMVAEVRWKSARIAARLPWSVPSCRKLRQQPFGPNAHICGRLRVSGTLVVMPQGWESLQILSCRPWRRVKRLSDGADFRASDAPETDDCGIEEVLKPVAAAWTGRSPDARRKRPHPMLAAATQSPNWPRTG